MSDHSSSTGSSGSSTNSWTLLSPEEVAVDNGGALDDGTESLGDAPSLSEDMAAGVAGEIKPSDIPVECVLSEEGHQVCQETAPESGDGHTLCCPLQPDQSEALDPESQAPVIHDIVTSSPCDNEHPGVAFVSSLDFGVPPDFAEPDETLREADNSVADEPEPVVIPAETVTASEPPWHGDADINRDQPEPPVGSGPADDVKAPESLGSMQVEDKEEEEGPPEFEIQEEQEEEGESPTGHHGDGLRRRTFQSGPNASDVEDEDDGDEDEDEEEMDFRLPETKEEKAWWSANKCIAGAAVLLFLGVLFLSGDFDTGDVSDAEQSQKAADALGNTGFFLTNEMSAEFQAVLDMFDTDGSGDISAKELGTVMRMLGENPLRRELSNIIKEAKEDADKLDGKKSREREGQKQDSGNRWRRVWVHLEKIRREISEGVERWNERRRKDPEKRRKDEGKEEWKRRNEWEAKKLQRRLDREKRRKEKPWRGQRKQRSDDMADFWRAQEHKLRRPSRPRRCASVEDCAAQEGLFPVELPEFQELLEGYLDKLEGSPAESKNVLRRLVANFFSGGVFVHDRRPFADFAEDVADILEDMADVAEGADDTLEEAMEEFEREALWKFAAVEQH
ncbi:stress response protein nst1 isoform X2 [Hippocampus comes]|uniref:Pre-B-cell leukemia homeobox interacting protein 1a n=1 Tax=Hippocampus comes TaxID=109280 RepID=A0A3Q3DQW1_HIPCM|nr:PREDICTED: stress response protein nst1-like isoform X2 [Hippocampus comes]